MAIKGDVTGLDVLQFGGKALIPLVSSYSGARKLGTIASQVPGGLTRQRKKYFNQPILKNASFLLETQQQQDYFKMFAYRNEGKPFICHLSAERPIVEPYVVQVVSDWDETFSSAVDGSFTVALEIVSVREPCLDDFLFPMYECVGDDLYCILVGYKDLVKSIPLE